MTYRERRDAHAAIAEFDGANAKGMPLRLTVASEVVPNAPGRSLFDRIDAPAPQRRARSLSASREGGRTRGPRRNNNGGPPTIDRYVPPGARVSSTEPRGGRNRAAPQGGRRPGERRRGGGAGGAGGAAGGAGGEKKGGGRRPKKTADELDAEMEDYFGGGGAAEGVDAGGNAGDVPVQVQAQTEDVDMIE